MLLMALVAILVPPDRGPRGNPAGPLRAASCASGEGGGSVRGALCSEIRLEEGKAPEWVQLFPPGPRLETVARDGRSWTLSAPQSVADASMTDGLDLPVDWEHSQDRRAARGERADAAGWINQIALRSGSLYGRIEWTTEGRASVESKAYRYISPAFTHATKITAGNLHGGEVQEIVGVALVNRPAFVLPALAGQGESTMLKKIITALGLAADATEAQAVAAIASLKSERDTAVAQAAAPSLDKFVPRADYDTALARATEAEGSLADQANQTQETKIKRELDAAQEAGKITPATRSYHEAQCRAEGGLEKFREFVAAAPEIAGASGAPNSQPPGTETATAAERKAARLMGHSVEFARKHGSTAAQEEEE